MDILKYIENPNSIRNADRAFLENLIADYPYYQTAHILLLKHLKDTESGDFESQLVKSSIYISDRDLLFRFLNETYEQESEIVEEINETTEIKKEETQDDSVATTKLLKNRNVKRKINNSFEGMGENISETISSQLEFSVVKEKDKLEYPSEIYFIDEERNGKNNILTIDADPDDTRKVVRKKDILQIVEKEEEKEHIEEVKTEDAFELLESEKVEAVKDQEPDNQNIYFDINHYADDDVIKESDDLISKFIEKNPRIETKDLNEEVKDVSEKSVVEDSNLLSETLIKVYIKQGLFEKAIQSYHKLSLKYPEKNAYFASQIEILQEKINKQ